MSVQPPARRPSRAPARDGYAPFAVECLVAFLFLLPSATVLFVAVHFVSKWW